MRLVDAVQGCRLPCSWLCNMLLPNTGCMKTPSLSCTCHPKVRHWQAGRRQAGESGCVVHGRPSSPLTRVSEMGGEARQLGWWKRVPADTGAQSPPCPGSNAAWWHRRGQIHQRVYGAETYCTPRRLIPVRKTALKRVHHVCAYNRIHQRGEHEAVCCAVWLSGHWSQGGAPMSAQFWWTGGSVITRPAAFAPGGRPRRALRAAGTRWLCSPDQGGV